MPVSFHVIHLYKYPLEIVANAHLHKYPEVTEKNITAMDTLEHYTSAATADPTDRVTYWRRIAHCRNIIPGLIRRFNSVLDQPEILIQEECWLHHRARLFRLQTQNLTWTEYVKTTEESEYRPASENPEWTECVQKGVVNIFGLGPLGPVIEKLSTAFFDKGIKKGIVLMERNLKSLSLKSPPY